MKIVEINATHRGSTGKIMLGIANVLRKNGDEAYTFSSAKKEEAPQGHEFFSTKLENFLHRLFSVTTGISGKGTKRSTKRLLEKIDKIKPDVLHLHNLHGWYINLPMLFDYIRKNNVKTVWTLHDCWAFTAQCSHFTIEKCMKWKTGCYDCPRCGLYPNTYIDRTKKMWHLKKQWFSGVKDLTIVTPSKWLGDLVKESFLQEYPVRVINNGIDLTVFNPTESDFKTKYELGEKRVVLGVAFGWGYRKGLDCFVELSKRLPENYQIVLVGTNDEVDKQLPSNIISIHKTNNQAELAQIYSAADVFVNCTREENYPTVNMEALACGTPVLTFKTGGSAEIIDESCGSAVETDDVDSIEKEIIRICEEKPYSKEACIEKAKSFDMNKRYDDYINLYKVEEREKD